jgi:pilus assembly protein CpaE
MANILLIDDDADFRSMLKLMLTRMNHTVSLASRGEDGFTQATTNKFDLVILDLMMPDVDGYELTRQLRAEASTRNVPILVVTARTQPADRESAREAGADGYLTKPVDNRELASRITEILASPRPERPLPSDSATKAATPITAPVAAATATGRVIVLLGLRGGMGKTTLAVNLAGALHRGGRRVCLLDLNPSVGHVTIHLRARPQASWADLPANVDSRAVAQVVTRHDSGLFLIAAPFKPVRGGLSVEGTQALLTQLRSSFADIVVDGGPALDDATCAALSVCRYAVLVVSPEVGSVQTAIATLRALPSLSVFDEQVKVILNYPNHEGHVSQAAVEKALGRAVDAVVPFDAGQVSAVAQGVPLIFGQANTPLAHAIAEFAATL